MSTTPMTCAEISERAQVRAALTVDDLEQEVAQARVGGALFGRGPVAARFGSYLLLDRVGAGAHGVVWSAYHRPTRRRVALKVLGPGSDHAAALAEARALARVSHPNVVAVFEAGSDADRPFVAMEWVAGPTLAVWLVQRPRSQREILAIFAQAARGLHAAHAQGVVHRDFKPANVLIGADERARVGDFGLALARGDGDAAAEVAAGTPAYMAPELLRRIGTAGARADSRSDQFAFFVALHEALVGCRPFAGADISRLRAAIAGNVRARSGLPRWLERRIARGLATDPSDRHADMLEVAAWLEHAAARRRAVSAWAIVGGLAVSMTAALADGAQRPRCETAEEATARVWAGPVRVSVAASLDAAEPASLAAPGARTVAQLDAWVARWSALQYAACATRDGVEAPTGDDMVCLRAGEREFTALVRVLGDADATVARHALDAAMQLDQPEHCASAPSGGEVDADIAAALAEVDALRVAGKPTEAFALARVVLSEARATGVELDVVASTVALGRAAEDAGEFDIAVSSLHDGFLRAYAARADALATTAAIRLLYIEGYMLERSERARIWQRAAAALQAERGLAGHDAPEVADLLANRGAVAEANGDHERALAHSLDALHMRERLFAAPHPELARAHNNIGVVLVGLQRFDDAIAAHRRALAQRRELHGESHPSVATSLHNIGFVHLRTGEVDVAERELTMAREIREATLGAWHPDVASSWGTIATVRELRGDVHGAIDALHHAAAIGARVWGEDHTRVTALRDRVLGLTRIAADPAKSGSRGMP